jgi:hypothetical protein
VLAIWAWAPGSMPALTGRRHGSEVVRLISALCASLVASWIAVVPTAAATEPGRPEVQLKSPVPVSPTSAIIEAEINPNGSNTTWEIRLECETPWSMPFKCEPVEGGAQRQEGRMEASSGIQTARSAVAVHEEYEYSYAVIASNAAGRAGYVGTRFVYCGYADEGGCLIAWSPGTSLASFEALEAYGSEAPQREAERQAKLRSEEAKMKEAPESPAKEAAARAAHEREVREAGERAGREAAERERPASKAGTTHCLVPDLKGESLDTARKALRRAHCALGKVGEPSPHSGPLVVTKQATPARHKLKKGAAVAVTLGRLAGARR